jgi:hypothetical protein
MRPTLLTTSQLEALRMMTSHWNILSLVDTRFPPGRLTWVGLLSTVPVL